ncbi:hypothetical protein MKX01_021075 [Papaver californicum]|nr:hypothetical protein MKX01_021075 [Papaver californicum]
MKEAIRMVPESIYDSEFPDTSHIRSGRHIIDRHRLIPILLEEIDDPKFFYHTQKPLGAGRRKMNGPDSVPHSELLSALPGNIYLHKIDQEIGRIRHKYEILMRIRSVLSQFSGRIDDQAVEEASFNVPQENRAIFLGRVKSIQRKASFHSLVSSWHTPPTSTPLRRGDQKTGGASALAAFLNKPSTFLVGQKTAVPKAEFYGRERNNWAMRDRKFSRRGLLIEMDGEARPVVRICYVRYADDLLLGIVGAVELLIEIQKRLTHFLQYGLNLWSAGPTTIAARSTVEFPGTVIREVHHSKQVKQEKRLWVKHRIHITAFHLRPAIHSQFKNLGKSLPIKELMGGMRGRRSLLDAVQLAETLGTAGVRSPKLRSEQGAIRRSHTIGHKCNDPEVVIVYLEGGGRKKGTLGEIFQQRIPYTDRGLYKKDTPKALGSRSH